MYSGGRVSRTHRCSAGLRFGQAVQSVAPDFVLQCAPANAEPFSGFRPIEEAISCAGGVQQVALSAQLQLQSNRYVFCCGEMLDWDAPTGGYLLTACFATGRAAGHGVASFLTS